MNLSKDAKDHLNMVTDMNIEIDSQIGIDDTIRKICTAVRREKNNSTTRGWDPALRIPTILYDRVSSFGTESVHEPVDQPVHEPVNDLDQNNDLYQPRQDTREGVRTRSMIQRKNELSYPRSWATTLQWNYVAYQLGIHLKGSNFTTERGHILQCLFDMSYLGKSTSSVRSSSRSSNLRPVKMSPAMVFLLHYHTDKVLALQWCAIMYRDIVLQEHVRSKGPEMELNGTVRDFASLFRVAREISTEPFITLEMMSFIRKNYKQEIRKICKGVQSSKVAYSSSVWDSQKHQRIFFGALIVLGTCWVGYWGGRMT